MITGPDQKPPPHSFYGDSYERGLDPWHQEAFPEHLKVSGLNDGLRRSGWFLNDAFGNAIAFTEDGTEI